MPRIGFENRRPTASTASTTDPAAPISAAPAPATAATTTVAASAPSPIVPNNPAISDEQDFQAVSARETIESDRARLEQAAAAYTVIQPTPVPDRPEGADPNIVAYALSTTNSVGQTIYSRSGLNAQARFQRACAGYASPDLAQIDFLKSGGPQKDRKGLDPDGDGFACSWDPTPFRLAANGG